MIPDLDKLQTVRDKNARVFLVATGGGAGAQGHLWNIPGISSVLVGAAFPYAPDDTDDFLGFTPVRYCSDATALDLAMEAYMRAFKPDGPPALGVGLTASVASMHAHRGEHRVFVSTFSAEGVTLRAVELRKGEGVLQRKIDGEACDLLCLNAVLTALGEKPLRENLDLLSDKEVPPEMAGRLASERFRAHPFFRGDGVRFKAPDSGNGFAFFPGAFNPPHQGHFGIAQAFEEDAGRRPIFTTTADPPHKPALSVAEMLQRAKLLKGHDRLFTFGDPLYLDKARRFEGGMFIIGADALVRMLDPKWGPNPKALTEEFLQLGVSFWVVDRVVDGNLLSYGRLKGEGKIPSEFPGQTLHGRWDISSTDLRAK